MKDIPMVQSLLSDWGLHCLETKPSTHEPIGDISYPNHNKLKYSKCTYCFHGLPNLAVYVPVKPPHMQDTIAITPVS